MCAILYNNTQTKVKETVAIISNRARVYNMKTQNDKKITAIKQMKIPIKDWMTSPSKLKGKEPIDKLDLLESQNTIISLIPTLERAHYFSGPSKYSVEELLIPLQSSKAQITFNFSSCSFFFFLWGWCGVVRDLVVWWRQVDGWEILYPAKRIQRFVYPRQWVSILPCLCIEATIIHTQTEGSRLLAD